MHELNLNLIELLGKLGQMRGRRYPISEFARSAGIGRTTATRLVNDDWQQVDRDTIPKIMAFFEAEGMPITISDLFSLREKEDPPD